MLMLQRQNLVVMTEIKYLKYLLWPFTEQVCQTWSRQNGSWEQAWPIRAPACCLLATIPWTSLSATHFLPKWERMEGNLKDKSLSTCGTCHRRAQTPRTCYRAGIMAAEQTSFKIISSRGVWVGYQFNVSVLLKGNYFKKLWFSLASQLSVNIQTHQGWCFTHPFIPHKEERQCMFKELKVPSASTFSFVQCCSLKKQTNI